MASTDARPVPIKNVAFRVVFPLLDADGDLITGATGLDSEVSKDQGTFADCTNEATEIATSSGLYYLDLTSTEMNADCVAVIVKTSSSGAKTTVLVFYPEEAGDINVDVTAFGGTAGTFASGRPEVNTTHLAGTSQTARDIGASVLLSSGTGTGQLSLSSGAVLLQATQTGVTIPTVTTLTNAPSDSSGVTTLLSRLSAARAGYLDNLSAGAVALASSLTSVAGDVTTILGKFTGITSLAQWLGLIAGKQTGNTTARTELRATGAGSGTFDETTDSQEALRDRGDAAWTTATGFSTHSAADVWAVGTRVLTAATNISGPIADQVWEEAIADHSGTAGSTAEQLSAAGSAGDPWATALPGAYTSGQAGKIVGDNLNATVSSRATPAQVATELGTYDGPTKAELDAAVAPLATAASLSSLVTTVGVAGAGLTEAGGTGDHLTAINLPDQTMNITGDITGNLSGSVGSVTGAVGSVTGAVGSVTGAVGSVTGNVGGNVTGSVGSLATQAKADVNTEVVDALATDVIADSVPADGSRPTIAQALYMLTQFMTERSVTSTTMTVKKPDGSTTLMTFTLDDATAPTSITRAS